MGQAMPQVFLPSFSILPNSLPPLFPVFVSLASCLFSCVFRRSKLLLFSIASASSPAPDCRCQVPYSSSPHQHAVFKPPLLSYSLLDHLAYLCGSLSCRLPAFLTRPGSPHHPNQLSLFALCSVCFYPLSHTSTKKPAWFTILCCNYRLTYLQPLHYYAINFFYFVSRVLLRSECSLVMKILILHCPLHCLQVCMIAFKT